MFLIKHRYLIPTLAIILLLTVAAPALAANMTVNPTLGGYNTTFSVSVSGLGGGEKVALWVTLPNLKSVSLGYDNAASNGTLDFEVTIDPKWPEGEYIAVAHGMSSKREYSVKFNMSGQPQPEPDPVVVEDPNGDDNHSYVFIGHPGGRTMWYQGRGYRANEWVTPWYHVANGPALTLPWVKADAWGNAYFKFTVPNGTRYGQILIVAKGWTSKWQTTNTVSWFGTLSDQRATDPIKRFAPKFNFVADGFVAGEKVAIWVTLPNGVSKELATVTTLDGLIDYTLEISPDMPYGGYVIVAQGLKSHYKTWQRFSYFGSVNPL